MIQVNREREVKGTNTSTTHYDLTSLKAEPTKGTKGDPGDRARTLGQLVRRHWAIEMTRSQYPPSDKLYGVVSPVGFECRPRDSLDFRPRHP